MNWLLDAIIILIILISAIVSFKKGFVKSLLELVGFTLAIVLSFSLSTPVSQFVYDMTVEPAIETTLISAANETNKNFYDAMPEFVKSLIDKSSLDLTTITEENAVTENAVKNIMETAVEPIVLNILRLASTVILFVLLLLVVKLFTKMFSALFRGGILGSVNKFLGGVLGLAKGAIFASVFSLLVSLILSLSDKGFLFITAEAVEKSYFCRCIIDILPIKF